MCSFKRGARENSFIQFIHQQLIALIVKEYHPFLIVEETELKKNVKLLCPEQFTDKKNSIA